MARSIFTPLDPAALMVAEDLLIRTQDANAAEPYVAADYDQPERALWYLLVATFGPDDAQRVREATYDGCTVARAVEVTQETVRANLAEEYAIAVDRQAEQDALNAFDRIVEGWNVVGALRTFAAATDHLETHGMVLALDLGGASVPRYADRDDADAAMARALDMVPA